MFKVVTGQAEGTDTSRTISCVIAQCKRQLDGLIPSAGVLYSADHFEHELTIKQIAEEFPGIELSGCTTGGEISSAQGFSQDSICLTLFVSDSISIATGFSDESSGNYETAIDQALSDALLKLNSEVRGCLLFPGSSIRTTRHHLESIHNRLGPECVIFGGVAGADDPNSAKVRLFNSNGIENKGFSLLLFAGPLKIESVICNSWEPVGYKSTIDDGEGYKIKRIGGKSALDYFRRAFGPYAEPLPEMPLALFDENGDFQLRSTHDYDEEEGSITTSIAIPKGSTIQLTEATPKRLLSNLRTNMESMVDRFETGWVPQAAMLFSCTSRRWILGMRTEEEIQIAKEVLPAHIPVSGFYTFGEIAALSAGKTPRLHNCTMVALVMGEEKSCSADFRPHVHKRTCFTSEERHELLEMKMERAGESQRRLEMQKDFFTNVLRRTSADLAKANRKIKEQNIIMKESLTMAEEVQQSLIPNYSPLVPSFEIAGRSLSCDETGGDYLDYLPDDNGLAVVVGDVSGHGVAAALVMTTARALLRMRADQGGQPSELIKDLNRLLTGDVRSSGRFMTLFYLYLNSTDHTLTWIRGGHDPALIYSPETDIFTELTGEGMALGIMDNIDFTQYRTQPLKEGEIVLVNTDGITEAHSPSGELFGRNRLKTFIRNNAEKSAPELLDLCFNEIKGYQQGQPTKDDETLVVIKAR